MTIAMMTIITNIVIISLSDILFLCNDWARDLKSIENFFHKRYPTSMTINNLQNGQYYIW